MVMIFITSNTYMYVYINKRPMDLTKYICYYRVLFKYVHNETLVICMNNMYL